MPPCRHMPFTTLPIPCSLTPKAMLRPGWVALKSPPPLNAVLVDWTRSEERRVGKECRSLCDWSSDVCSSDLDAPHPMLPDPKGDVTSGVGRAKEPAALERGARRLDEIGSPTDHRRDVALEGVHHCGPSLSGSQLLCVRWVPAWQRLLVAGLRHAAPGPVPLLRKLR